MISYCSNYEGNGVSRVLFMVILLDCLKGYVVTAAPLPPPGYTGTRFEVVNDVAAECCRYFGTSLAFEDDEI